MRKALFRLAACLMGFIVAFGALELTIRLTQPTVDLDERTGNLAGSHPMADWAQVDAFSAYRGRPGGYLHEGRKTVNSQGFISTPEVPYEKTEGTLRVVYLGGSSTACSVPILPDEESWPTIASNRLAETIRLDWINGALPGYSSFESYARLWSRLRFYRPDVVVIYQGWNDLYYWNDPDQLRVRHVGPDGEWSFARPMVRKRIQPHWIDSYIEWSQLLCRVRRHFGETLRGEVGAEGGELSADYSPRGPQIFRENLRLLLAAQEILGFQLYVAKQATLITADLDPRTRGKCRCEFHGFDYEAHLRAYAEIYRIIDEEVAADRVLDLTHLNGQTKYLFDHVHLTAEGSRAVGQSVAEQLLRHLRP